VFGSDVLQNEKRLEEETRARAAAQNNEMLKRLLNQITRPTLAARTETSVTLSMSRVLKPGADDKASPPAGCLP
jgi:hypothetical protein